jgi:dTDP-D-glucose 4,6-dehydratase
MIAPMRSSSCSGTETINVSTVVGFKGEIEFDTSRPDGTPRKLLDVSRLTALGWQAHTGLKEGITSTYQWLDHQHAHGNGPRGFPNTAINWNWRMNDD